MQLEQSAGKGVNVYTHGETLPAFGSPTVLNVRVEKFVLAPLTTPDADRNALAG